jgi:hypothetical protein
MAEIKRALEGAWLIARQDPSAMSRFDLTVEGFWASFFAAVLAAPGWVVLVVDQYSRQGLGPNLGEVVLIETLAYAIRWIAFPLFALVLTQMLGLGRRYVPLIVASNWGSVLRVALLAAAALIGGFLPDPLGLTLAFFAGLVTLAYQWQIFRTALETTGLIAAGLILVDILLSVLIQLSADGLIQQG